MEFATRIDLSHQGQRTGVGNDISVEIQGFEPFEVIGEKRDVVWSQVGIEGQIEPFAPGDGQFLGPGQGVPVESSGRSPQTELFPSYNFV